MKRERQIPTTNHRSPITRANSTDEFAPGASQWPAGLSRREFLRLSSATLALAGLGACTKQPLEKIVPYVEQPEVVIPGNPLRFATATQYNGFGQGLLVTGYEGRPTKIEGNPTHPASLGATSVWAQADILDLYDPDRAQTVTTGGGIKTLDDFWNALNLALESVKSAAGATLRILTEAISSPTLLAQLADVMQKFPAARWCIWDPLNRDNLNANEGLCDFSKAKVVVALDSDFLYTHPYALRYARDFSNARRTIVLPFQRKISCRSLKSLRRILGSARGPQGKSTIKIGSRRSSATSTPIAVPALSSPAKHSRQKCTLSCHRST